MTSTQLREWRAHWHLSRANLARQLGVNVRTVANWEDGRSPMPAYLDLALAELGRRLAAELLERARGPLTTNAARSTR